MKIRKMFQGTIPENKILDGHSSSKTDTYCCNYLNNQFNITNNKFNYSEIEQIIGKWIDNKPIYRKVIDLGSINWNSTPKTFVHNISNLDVCIDLYWFGYFTGNNRWYMSWDAINGKNIMVDTTNIYISNISADTTFSKNYIVIEYTKTTD